MTSTGITVRMWSSRCAIHWRRAPAEPFVTTECGPDWWYRTRFWRGLARGSGQGRDPWQAATEVALAESQDSAARLESVLQMPELGRLWVYPALWVAVILTAMGTLVYLRRRGWIADFSSQGDDAGDE
ncbi:MAG TPA: hypothetical protein DEP35_02295 [Deltaproteobacteria bacterium]|nr:hypothetical protein [Deltaproteobacteria bacterium]